MAITIEESLVQEITCNLPSGSRTAFTQRVARLGALPDEPTSMTEFLTVFAELVADLYAASSVVVWFRSPQREIERKISVGWSNLRMDKLTTDAHEKLIDYSIVQSQPLAVPPFSAPEPGCGVSNPTDSYLLLGPVQYQGQPLAIVEIALGPKPLRRPHRELVAQHLSWLNWLAEVFRVGTQQRFASSQIPLQAALDHVARMTHRADEIQEQIRVSIQDSLRTLMGSNFGSIEDNQLVAREVHALLESKGLRVRCPECGSAAILRCQKAGNTKTGAFVFDHYLDGGRTFHGGISIMPELTLMPKPPRRNRKSGASAGE